MAEYVELIYKYLLIRGECGTLSYNKVENTGKIVRCKDCKQFYFSENRIPDEQEWTCALYGVYRCPDDFCSRGERSGGDAE